MNDRAVDTDMSMLITIRSPLPRHDACDQAPTGFSLTPGLQRPTAGHEELGRSPLPCMHAALA